MVGFNTSSVVSKVILVAQWHLLYLHFLGLVLRITRVIRPQRLNWGEAFRELVRKEAEILCSSEMASCHI